jgi:molybdopterin synthase catalytic subunit
MRVEIVAKGFSPEMELATFSRNNAVGAVASFTGYCRDEGGMVNWLELEHYPGFTEAQIGHLVASVATRYSLINALVIHRVGAIQAGEPIVLVAASSVHRAAALAAINELMDYLKSEAPIWKKEIGAHGDVWVEPTVQDYRAAAQWRTTSATTDTETPPPRGGRGRGGGGGESVAGGECANVAGRDRGAPAPLRAGRRALQLSNFTASSPHPLTPSPSRGGGEEDTSP